jgi:hypothetical protein
MSESCANCKYSELVAKEGEEYSYMNPVGEEIVRVYPHTVLICRGMPPIAGSWPQVTPEDWCGQGKFN